MLKTLDDILTESVERFGISTTSGFYTDTMLKNWIKQADRWATSYKKWPMTEGRLSTTYVSGTEEWNFEGIKAESIRFLTIGGKRYRKLNFEDYQIFREESSSGDDRVFSDFNRILLVNPNAPDTGTMTTYFQYAPVEIDVTDHTSETVFSNGDEEGNEAYVERVLYYAYLHDRKHDEATYHEQKAKELLEQVWTKVQEEQYQYHSHRDRGGMFGRIDVVNGGFPGDLVQRDQFPNL